jgi:hypothetical protein
LNIFLLAGPLFRRGHSWGHPVTSRELCKQTPSFVIGQDNPYRIITLDQLLSFSHQGHFGNHYFATGRGKMEFGNRFPASVIADLNRYEAVVKLLEDGTNKEPFRARMLPPLENRIGRKEKLIARSRERFAVRRAVIEDKLNRWMA